MTILNTLPLIANLHFLLMSTAEVSLCNEKVFSQIFLEYSKTLHNYLYYKSGNSELAKDITQESFLRLWKNCNEVSLKTAKGYVFKIGSNQLLNTFDHQKVRLKFQQITPRNQTQESPQYLLEEKEFKLKLDQAISELPEKQRVVFLMSRIDKKTYKEIADLLGISKQAVEKRIYNALNKLRKISKKIK